MDYQSGVTCTLLCNLVLSHRYTCSLCFNALSWWHTVTHSLSKWGPNMYSYTHIFMCNKYIYWCQWKQPLPGLLSCLVCTAQCVRARRGALRYGDAYGWGKVWCESARTKMGCKGRMLDVVMNTHVCLMVVIWFNSYISPNDAELNIPQNMSNLSFGKAYTLHWAKNYMVHQPICKYVVIANEATPISHIMLFSLS